MNSADFAERSRYSIFETTYRTTLSGLLRWVFVLLLSLLGSAFAHAFTVETTIYGQGSVEVSPDKDAYVSTESVSLTATAAEGYYFTGWSGHPSVRFLRESPSITLETRDDLDLVAVFLPENEDGLHLISGGDSPLIEPSDSEAYPEGLSGYALRLPSSATAGSEGFIEVIVQGPRALSFYSKYDDEIQVSYDSLLIEASKSEYNAEASVYENVYAIPAGRHLVRLSTSSPTERVYDLRLPPGIILDIGPASKLTVTPSKEVYDIGETISIETLDTPSDRFILWTRDLSGKGNSIDISLQDHIFASALFATGDTVKDYFWRTGDGNAAYNLRTTHRDETNQYWEWRASDREDGLAWLELDIAGPASITYEGDGGDTVLLNGEEIDGSPIYLKKGDYTLRWESDKANPGNWNAVHTIENLSIVEGITLNFRSTPGGTVARSPLKSTYKEGDTISLFATPKPGYEFVEWAGDISSTEPIPAITIEDTLEVIPVFANKGAIDGFQWESRSEPPWQVVSEGAPSIDILKLSNLTAEPDGPLSIAIPGPGKLSFETSSTLGRTDVSLNGEPLLSLSRFDEEWEEHHVQLPSGINLLSMKAFHFSFDKPESFVAIRSLQVEEGFQVSYPDAIPGGAIDVNLAQGLHPRDATVVLDATPNEGNRLYSWGVEGLDTAKTLSFSLDRNLDLNPQFVAEQLSFPARNISATGNSSWPYVDGKLINDGKGDLSFEIEGPGILSFDLIKPEDPFALGGRIYVNDRSSYTHRNSSIPSEGVKNVSLEIPAGWNSITVSPDLGLHEHGIFIFENLIFEEGYRIRLGFNDGGTIDIGSENTIFPAGEKITATPISDPHYKLVSWNLRDDAGFTYLETPSIDLTMDQHYRLSAIFNLETEDGEFYTGGLGTFEEIDSDSGQSSKALRVSSDTGEASSIHVSLVHDSSPQNISFFAKVASGAISYFDEEAREYIAIETSAQWTQHDIEIIPDRFGRPSNLSIIFSSETGEVDIQIDELKVDHRGSIFIFAPNGQITIEPVKEIYAIGDTVSLTATPDEGYSFRGWRGGVVSNESSTTTPIVAIEPIQAVFAKDLFWDGRFWEVSGNGSWEISNENALSGSAGFNRGSLATHRFDGAGEVTFDISFEEYSYPGVFHVILDGEIVLTKTQFNFDDVSRKLSVGPGEHVIEFELIGSTDESEFEHTFSQVFLESFEFNEGFAIILETDSVEASVSPEKERYAYGDNVTIELVDPNADFISWTGDLEGEEARAELVIKSHIQAELVAKRRFLAWDLEMESQSPNSWKFENGVLKSGRAGSRGSDEHSVMTTTVTGPGTLKLDWRNQKGIESGIAVFRLLLDEEIIIQDDQLDRSIVYENEILIPEGEHTLAFHFLIWTGGPEPFHESFYAEISEMSFHPALSDVEREMIHRAVFVLDIRLVQDDQDFAILRLTEDQLSGDAFIAANDEFDLWGYSFDDLGNGQVILDIWTKKIGEHLEPVLETSANSKDWLSLDVAPELDDRGTFSADDDLQRYSLLLDKTDLPLFLRYSVLIKD